MFPSVAIIKYYMYYCNIWSFYEINIGYQISKGLLYPGLIRFPDKCHSLSTVLWDTWVIRDHPDWSRYTWTLNNVSTFQLICNNTPVPKKLLDCCQHLEGGSFYVYYVHVCITYIKVLKTQEGNFQSILRVFKT